MGHNRRISAGKIIQNSILKIDSLPRIVQDDAISSYYSKDDFDKLGDNEKTLRVKYAVTEGFLYYWK